MAIFSGSAVLYGLWTALAGLISAIFVQAVTWFSKRAVKVVIIKTAIIAGLVLLTGSLFAALNVSINSISLSMPAIMVQSFSMFLPSNTTMCLSVVVSTKVLLWVYRWQRHFIEMYLSSI